MLMVSVCSCTLMLKTKTVIKWHIGEKEEEVTKLGIEEDLEVEKDSTEGKKEVILIQ